MRVTWTQASGVLLLLSVLLGTALADGALAGPSLLLGAVAAMLVAWGVTRVGRASPTAGAGPAVAARARTLARRAVPRQRDPDAAGRVRSRAPSGLIPAV